MIPVKPYTLQELEDRASPAAVPGGNMEAYVTERYDTQTYPAAGTERLTFFQNTNADRTISNMDSAGQFPDPEFFILYYHYFDVLTPVSEDPASAVAWVDKQNIIQIGRPRLTLTVSNKEYDLGLAQSASASGGLTGEGIAGDTSAAINRSAYANNGIPGRGFCDAGGIMFRPKSSFRWVCEWGNPQAVTADTLVRIVMRGVIYRSIQ